MLINAIENVPDEVNAMVSGINGTICDLILVKLRERGYVAREVSRRDTYFIFGGYGNSVISFRLSRVWPGWLFGMWIHGECLLDDSEPSAKVVQLFCMHDTQIDKFKPSESELLVELTKADVEYLLKIDSDEASKTSELLSVTALADMVRMHPFLAYHGVVRERPMDWYTAVTTHPMLVTLSWMVYERRRDAKRRLSHEYWRRWANRRMSVACSKPYVIICGLRNYGEHSWPRLEVFCYLEDDPGDAALDEMWALWRLWKDVDRGWDETTLRINVYYKADGKECQLY